MLLEVIHETRYHYPNPVGSAQHLSCLQPVDRAGQSVLDYALQIEPAPATQYTQPDAYGNPRCYFSLHAPHDSLRVCATSRVRTTAPVAPDSQIPWEAVRDHFLYQAGRPVEPASEFAFASQYAQRHAQFAHYARPSFPSGWPMLQACIDLMQRIHNDFTYQAHSTDIGTPALQALEQRRGVCQDFAHILIACLRSMGLAARYVSGYLLTQVNDEAERMVGGDASHAWVSVYLPDFPEGARWFDLDPTNDRWGWHSPGQDYITVATGRDFGDVSPLRGVIRGGAQHTLTVGVTVRPLRDNARLQTPPNKEKP